MYINDYNHDNRIVFVTGTRADYGKMKSLIRAVHEKSDFEVHIFATGMHMLSKYGATYKEIIKDGFPNIYTYINQNNTTNMDIALSNTITGFANYIAEIHPVAIIVHGDRLEALAGAIVGAFNNIKVFHIEGGEVSGTIDESIRHAISKFSHYHFVANEAAKKRIIQLGEPASNVFIFGSPDIDIMHSASLPSLSEMKNHYDIQFERYNIFMFHPVTTEVDQLHTHIHSIIKGLLESQDNYVVIYPNNDNGSNVIIEALSPLTENPHFRIFPSMRFEFFLTLLKHASMIIGNSSSGIREACIYGIPAIDIGTRQEGRYELKHTPHVIHVAPDTQALLTAIKKAHTLSIKPQSYFGNGDSDTIFLEILKDETIWKSQVQKKFIDVDF